jgi:predicted DCC family thiol-disulfide oxidoreductase YuxK
VRSTSSSSGPVLLYDGTCGFCAASVQFILRHEREHTLRFAALDSEVGQRTRQRHPQLKSIDSMIWIEHPGETEREAVLIRSDAGLRIARYLGGPWRLAAVGRLVPRFLRDAVYDVIARHRHRLVSESDSCYLPPPAMRARFLDAR